jgi:hypothetical protein
MSTEATAHYQYQHFYGIWDEIDNNDINRLAVHPKLLEDINEKQRGLTPLHLVTRIVC